MKKIVLKAVLATAVMAPVLAQAQSAYVGASILVSRQNSGGNLQFANDTSQSDVGFKLVTGYHFNDKFGIEAAYVDMGDSVVAGNLLLVAPRALYLAGTGTWQLSPHFALTGKLGLAANRSKFSTFSGSQTHTENKTTVMAGFGTVFTITKRMQGVVEYEHFGKVVNVSGGSVTVDTISTGVRFNF